MKKFVSFILLATFFTFTHAEQAADAATVAKWRKYYAEHLPEAKKMLEACVAKGFGNMQAEEQIKCETARNAWHFQPYKSSPAKFSSSGGRH